MMARWRLVIIMVTISIASPVAGADWLQAGYDAARTGNVAEPGPLTDDIVYRFQLDRMNGSRPFGQYPIVLDNVLFVPETFGGEQLGEFAPRVRIHRLDMTQRVWHGSDERIGGQNYLASDGTLVYQLAGGIIYAREAREGKVEWTIAASEQVETLDEQVPYQVLWCEQHVVDGDRLFVGCRHSTDSSMITVRAIDLASRQALWEWTSKVPDPEWVEAFSDVASQPFQNITAYAGGAENPNTDFGGLAVVNSTVLLLLNHPTGGHVIHELIAIDRESGATRWMRADANVVTQKTIASGASAPGPQNLAGAPTGNDQALFAEFQELVAYGHDGTEVARSSTLRPDNRYEGDEYSGVALTETALYVASAAEIVRFDLELRPGSARHVLAPEERTMHGGLIATSSCIFVASYRFGTVQDSLLRSPTWIHCLSPTDLSLVWRLEFGPLARFAVADDLLVVHDAFGMVTLVGHGPGAIDARAALSNAYPTTDSALAVDLSGSGAGIDGAPTLFKVDWGDGTSVDWQTSPRLAHRYALNGDYTIRAWARNEAGQVSSTTADVHVGAIDPSLNAFERAFIPQNQERTFFILGLVATLILAAFGVLRLRLRHARMQRELRAIETEFQTAKDDPDACDALLVAKKGRVRDLLLTRRLDESQCQVLHQRIDELHRGNRMRLVDARFEFLPLGMVKRLRAILEDGRVTELERSHFLQTLTQDATMTKPQKENVRKLIEAWFEGDRRRAV